MEMNKRVGQEDQNVATRRKIVIGFVQKNQVEKNQRRKLNRS